MEDKEPRLNISCHQIKLPVLEMGDLQSSSWPTASYGNPQRSQSITMAIDDSPQYLHNHRTQRSWAGTYLEPSLLPSTHGPGSYSVCYQRRKVNTNPATNPVIYNSDMLG